LFVDFSTSTAENFIEECHVASKFNHPNVLSLIGVCIIPEETTPLMVMPYMHHGDVKSFLKSKRGSNIKVENFPSVKLANCSVYFTTYKVVKLIFSLGLSYLIFSNVT